MTGILIWKGKIWSQTHVERRWHREMAISLQRELKPWVQTSSLWNCETISFCDLSHSVYSTWLQQSYQTNLPCFLGHISSVFSTLWYDISVVPDFPPSFLEISDSSIYLQVLSCVFQSLFTSLHVLPIWHILPEVLVLWMLFLASLILLVDTKMRIRNRGHRKGH